MNKEGSSYITRILKVWFSFVFLFWFPYFVTHMHDASPLSHEYIVLQCWNRMETRNIYGVIQKKNLMAEFLVCLLCAFFYTRIFFLWFSMNLRNLDHRACMTVIKRNWKEVIGVSAVAEWNWEHLCSMRTQVGSPVQQNGLKDLVLPPQLWLRSDPCPGNSLCLGGAKKVKMKSDHSKI